MPQRRWFDLFVHLSFVLALYSGLLMMVKYPEWRRRRQCDQKCGEYWTMNVEETQDFTDFNNQVGRRDGRYVVPNLIHFVRVDGGELTFTEMICLSAALKNQRPKVLYVHTDRLLTGQYWDELMSDHRIRRVVKPVSGVSIPRKIKGFQLNPDIVKTYGRLILKLNILMKYGGIILDNHTYVVKSLNDFRRFEMTLDGSHSKTTKVILANKNARLLKIWMMYFFTVRHPKNGSYIRDIIYSDHSDLFHPELYFLADNDEILKKIYFEKWSKWINHYVIHLPHNNSGSKYMDYNESSFHSLKGILKNMILDVYNK